MQFSVYNERISFQFKFYFGGLRGKNFVQTLKTASKITALTIAADW